jgi:hypothetical protein
VVPQTIVFDVWTGNWDRNIGNFIEDEPPRDSQSADALVTIFAIDFEKAAVLRGEPDRFTLTGWPSKKFFPVEDLGRLCRDFSPPWDFCDRIAALESNVVAGVLEQVRMDLDLMTVPWLQGAVQVLRHRAQNLHRLVQEAWHV